jgi:serine protease Do
MRRRIVTAVGLCALVLAACGGDGGIESVVTEPPDTATDGSVADTAPDDTIPTTGGPQEGFDQVQPAVIQIIANGTIRDPEVGQVSNAGSGSGFIISPDGIAVTNNHVVTGAATLEVYIGGELDRSFNATVLGVSECNDLAVIDIAEDAPLPYLTWSDEEIAAGLEVYAAGYPLGDPEFTLTRGIVAKAEASGDVPWASIDSTIEHDAAIQPGNSGGPLVDANGHVVGVNYAVGAAVSTAQFFAIRRDLAEPVVDKLKNGDFESLGINGTAIADDESGLAGVWVSGVAAGSPASDTGVLPGDIVTSLNGLPIAADGTYADYCDVLRTAGSGKPIGIEVLRFDTQEVLRGEINGDKPLEPAFSIADAVEEETDPGTGTGTGGTAITGYQTLVDDTGAIQVDVPVEWADVRTAPFVLDDGTQLPFIEASTSIAEFEASYNVPGLFFTRYEGSGVPADELLATFAPSAGECTDGGISDYSDSVFTGRYQIWENCAGTTAIYVVVAAVPTGGAYTAILAVQITNDAELDALQQAFATFNVFG